MSRNARAVGGRPARTRIVQVVANPDGNRAQRRAAAKVARMCPEDAARLPRAAEDPQPGWWTEYASRGNGR